jgi:uncharacterized protein (TIGR02452 family)
MQQNLFDYFKKNPNVEIWEDTVNACSNRYGRFSHISKPHKSQVIRDIPNVSLKHKKYSSTNILVKNCRTLDMAYDLVVKMGLKPLVLNMASNYRPGGGVRKGSRAQEEDLFRKTNYFLTLDKRKLPKSVYPLKGLTVIYSPKVSVLKNSKYQDLNRPFKVDFIACPAVRNPEQIKNSLGEWDYLSSADRYLMEQRIRRIYEIGYIKGHDCLLLGALGCGAFHNPVVQVAKIFKKLNDEFDGCFKYIAFSIYSGQGNPNFKIFKDKLNK